MKKTGLGRGLGALISETRTVPPATSQEDTADNAVLMLDIRKLVPNPTQPRQFYDEAALGELADSMKNFGIVQPLLVNEEDGHYLIIAGERRYRAARLAGLTEVPVIVKNYSPMEILQVALIENIQRQDLTAIEEAQCFRRLMDDFFFSADDVAQKLGKNKHAVIAALHLLELSLPAQQLAAEGKITASHAKVLLSVEDEEMQARCAERIAEEALSVREAEAMVAGALKSAVKRQPTERNDDVSVAVAHAEKQISQALGTAVRIVAGKKKSKIEIEYYSTSDLERILERLA
jgi:ParB family chromosome partitioning protein